MTVSYGLKNSNPEHSKLHNSFENERTDIGRHIAVTARNSCVSERAVRIIAVVRVDYATTGNNAQTSRSNRHRVKSMQENLALHYIAMTKSHVRC